MSHPADSKITLLSNQELNTLYTNIETIRLLSLLSCHVVLAAAVSGKQLVHNSWGALRSELRSVPHDLFPSLNSA